MRSLTQIVARFEGELDDLQQGFTSLIATAAVPPRRIGDNRAATEGAVIFLFDSWGRFVRHTVLMSASRRVIGITGNHYARAPFNNHAAALAHLQANKTSISGFQHGEPQWHLQRAALDAISVLSPPNASQLRAAIGALVTSPVQHNGSTSISDLHRARNYIAHKGPSAAARFQPILTSSGTRSVLEWLVQPIAGATRFDDLVANLRATARLATR